VQNFRKAEVISVAIFSSKVQFHKFIYFGAVVHWLLLLLAMHVLC